MTLIYGKIRCGKIMSDFVVSPDQLLSVIESRQSIGQLIEPAPDQLTLELAIQAGLSAPDHHRLRPWQFLQVRGDARHAFGQALLQALIASGESDQAQLDRVLAQPLRAPLILVCVVDTKQHPKVPVVEQVLSMGAAIQNILLMLHVQGYAGMWRTGPLAESSALKTQLGLKADDEIAGFVYIGTPAKQLPARASLPVSSFLKDWT
jgi:nitroreductase